MVMDPSSITRITGMATGLDTDSIVKKLMQVEQIPLDQMKQKEQKYTWESDAYRQWNSDLFSFKTTTLFNMKLSGTYNTFDVSSSNTTAVTGTATSNAITGSYNLTVTSLASAATFSSTGVAIDPTKALNDATAQGTRAIPATVTSPISLSLSVVDPQTSQTHAATISIDPTKTINDVINSINTAKDLNGQSLGLQAIYDQNLQQFILRTKSTGANATIDLSGNSGNTDAMNFLSNTLGLNTSTLIQKGTNANVTFNGAPVPNLSTNTTTLMGINMTFMNTTSSTTITVSNDVDTEVKNIKDFVDKYNDMLDKLNNAISEPVYKDYQPLTDDQRSAMSDTQITQWETKAKSGLLHNDSILSDLVNKMRSDMITVVGNGSQYNSLASIGISSKSYQDKGKLYVDEDKLRTAIQNDPDAVKNLFSFTGDSSTNGIMNRVSDDMDQAIKNLTTKAGATGSSQYDQSFIGNLLTQTQTSILQKQDELNRKENDYYNQFAAMEQAVNKYNSQSSWLMQSLGGMGGQ
jgi:flagellar hook-associated protein 2